MKLTVNGCRERQDRLRSVLDARNLAGALISRRDLVYYFTGFHRNRHHASAALIGSEGKTTLVCAAEPDLPAVEEVILYAAAYFATMHNRQFEVVAEKFSPALTPGARLGADLGGGVACIAQLGGPEVEDLTPDIRRMRQSKLPDEVDAISAAIEVTDVMYHAAREAVQPDADELDVFTAIHSASVSFAGEDLEHFGNDFRSNDAGGLPRRRRMREGELYILDAGPSLHGYFADNCRTFSVGRSPSPAQQEAWEIIDSLFPIIEAAVKPGVEAREVYAIAHRYLNRDGYEGLVHHLGHGIGLAPHEAPELNPHYHATFEVGDVFTMEPGLYGPALKAGIRLEENYLLESGGLRKLTSYPRDLA